MRAGNDDFIRRRTCDLALTESGDEQNFLHHRSLSEMWAGVPDEVNGACAKPKPGTPVAGKKSSKKAKSSDVDHAQ